MNGVYINRKFYQVPCLYNELSAVQLKEIAGILHAEIPLPEARVRLLLSLLNVPRSLRLQWHFLFSISDESRYDMEMLADWILEGTNGLTKQLLPCLWVPSLWPFGSKLYGPANELSNLSFIEFIKAESAYISYAKTRNPEALDLLVAILYRPKRKDYNPSSPEYDGDIREKYNDHLLASRIQLVNRLPLATRQAVFLYYDGCRSLILKQYENVFRKPKNGEGDAKGRGWGHVLRSLAGSVNEYERTAFQPLGTVLADLDMAIQESDELQERLEALKNQQ
jgi:hypothetical protein